MAEERLKTAYIVGSGFSVGVGGPLLYDLLSDRGQAEMLARFPALKPCEYVYNVFWQHQRNNPKAVGKEILWSQAEEFLDYVNTIASTTGDRASVLEKILRDPSLGSFTTIAAFARLAAFAIAAECSFAMGQNPLRESWEPYVAWARELQRPDAVITFNYDTVLETIARHTPDIATNLKKSSVVLPRDPSMPKDNQVIPVFKLHGSTEWFMKGNIGSATYSYNEEGEPPLNLETAFQHGFTPLMGMPGPSKRDHCTQQFDGLWELARHHLRTADVLVFMGYRFPPSDSFARTELLTALKDNEKKYLRIHTVLGPNLHHENTVRLTKLLELTMKAAGRFQYPEPQSRPHPNYSPSFALLPQPLYVEDFMTVISDRELFGHDPPG
jgi:hypothetical protein